MSPAGSCRVLVDRVPAPGAWNMAVDQLLLEAAAASGCCSLRFYFWSRPTVSIGYFQDLGAVSALPHLAGLPVVRRLSGGGAIVHDHELTYCCALPRAHPLAARPLEAYDVVHRAFLAVLAECGFTAVLRGTRDASRDGLLLCFGRADAFDLVMGGFKVLGSAQRRRKGAVLQHGSLLLRRSPHTPDFLGLCDLGRREVDIDLLLERLAAAVPAALRVEPLAGRLTELEEARARALSTVGSMLSAGGNDATH